MWVETCNLHLQRLKIHLLLSTIFGSPRARFRNFLRVDWFIRFNHFLNLAFIKPNVRTLSIKSHVSTHLSVSDLSLLGSFEMAALCSPYNLDVTALVCHRDSWMSSSISKWVQFLIIVGLILQCLKNYFITDHIFD